MDVLLKGDLKSYLRNHRSNVELIDKQGLLLNFACDMAAGLQALHQANYVHRSVWGAMHQANYIHRSVWGNAPG